MKILLAKALLRCLSWLPLSWARGLGALLGRLAYRVGGRYNRVIRTNLAACFPELDETALRRLHKANLAATGVTLLESGAVWRWPAGRLLARVEAIDGREHLEQALARGRGVIIAGAHLNNWEMMNMVGPELAPMIALYRAPNAPAADRYITRARSRSGAELVASGGIAMRRMVRQLRDGGLVGLLCDQQPKQGEGVFAPFFGIEALTMTLLGRLTHRTGCDVVLINCERTRSGWRIRLTRGPADLHAPDSRTAATALNAAVEQEIRTRPEEYLWAYKRFSIRPPGAPPFY